MNFIGIVFSNTKENANAFSLSKDEFSFFSLLQCMIQILCRAIDLEKLLTAGNAQFILVGSYVDLSLCKVAARRTQFG